MKIDVKITNLGKLKEGSFKIRPITLLTGPNGTGKSFLTKSLYSLLNVINTNAYHLDLTKNISRCKVLLNSFKSGLSYPGEYDYRIISKINSNLEDLQNQLNLATELDLNEYFDFSKSKVGDLDVILSCFRKYLASLSKKPKKKESIKLHSKSISKSLDILKRNLDNGIDNYSSSLQENLENEIKENFQISDLSQLVSFDETVSRIDIDDLVYIEFGKSGVRFSLLHDFINKVSSLSRVVFFESPAYWKVRDALKSAKENLQLKYYIGSKSNSRLIGVPKYFYDLDEALNEHTKNSDLTEIKDIIINIEKELGGEFVFSGDDLVFKDNISKREISKNLISFGMTNLGMIHALLKNDVITPGSFVFIDEPETNLHPKWQVLLMDTLIMLADKNINIVIATHSIDMLKALEVGLNERDETMNTDFMSIHYLDTDGYLLDFESNEPIEQLREARNELSSPYESLFLKGCN